MNFFINLYRDDEHEVINYQVKGFGAIGVEEDEVLTAPVVDDEIRDAVFAMNGNKAPEVDELAALFYQGQWQVVGNSPCNFVKKVSNHETWDSEVNRTLIVLIPKMENPETLNHFRPISLCTVSYNL